MSSWRWNEVLPRGSIQLPLSLFQGQRLSITTTPFPEGANLLPRDRNRKNSFWVVILYCIRFCSFVNYISWIKNLILRWSVRTRFGIRVFISGSRLPEGGPCEAEGKWKPYYWIIENLTLMSNHFEGTGSPLISITLNGFIGYEHSSNFSSPLEVIFLIRPDMPV